MSAPFARKWVYGALRALQTPREQMWLGAGLATLLVVLFGPGSLTSHTTRPGQGSYHTGKPQPASRSLPSGQLPEAPQSANNSDFATSNGSEQVIESINPSQSASRPLPSGQLPEAPQSANNSDFATGHGSEQVIESINPLQSASRPLPSGQLPEATKPGHEK